jgi:hypothetical protein
MRKIVIGMLVVFLLSLLVACDKETTPATAPAPAPGPPLTQTPKTTKFTPLPGEKGIIGAAGSYPLLPIEEIIRLSDAGVIGRVTDILLAKRAKNPAPVPPEIIYQDVIIQVKQYLFGGHGSEFIAVRVLGGKIGNEYFLAEGVDPDFTVGEEVLLFLYVPPADTVYVEAVPKGTDPTTIYKVSTSFPGKFLLEDNTAINFKGETMDISIIEEKVASVLAGE